MNRGWGLQDRNVYPAKSIRVIKLGEITTLSPSSSKPPRDDVTTSGRVTHLWHMWVVLQSRPYHAERLQLLFTDLNTYHLCWVKVLTDFNDSKQSSRVDIDRRWFQKG